jgi:hypothetical protein
LSERVPKIKLLPQPMAVPKPKPNPLWPPMASADRSHRRLRQAPTLHLSAADGRNAMKRS